MLETLAVLASAFTAATAAAGDDIDLGYMANQSSFEDARRVRPSDLRIGKPWSCRTNWVNGDSGEETLRFKSLGKKKKPARAKDAYVNVGREGAEEIYARVSGGEMFGVAPSSVDRKLVVTKFVRVAAESSLMQSIEKGDLIVEEVAPEATALPRAGFETSLGTLLRPHSKSTEERPVAVGYGICRRPDSG